MLAEYKKDNEKTAMGLLSYLPDFKNLQNLQEEIQLNRDSDDFKLYLYKDDHSNYIGVVGTQVNNRFIVVRYISLAPGFREKKYEVDILRDLIKAHPGEKVTTVPEYTYLIKYLYKPHE